MKKGVNESNKREQRRRGEGMEEGRGWGEAGADCADI